ncbi:hypothetical protein SEUCBS139899_006730 [Sporothrix eucalyptigena]|uniref:Extracellular membrane protein CFEM domain-containing protein n=1 Tax=Sporothrix eucalyptigena TaxID=1812306 RepID=A0ABP0CHZ9_9PEZI
MDTRRQSRRLSSTTVFSLLFLLLLQTTTVLAAFTNNFDAYPSGTRSCLNASAIASGCDGDTVTSMNDCLCSNTGNFVIASAECVGKSDYADLETVYTTMASACSFSNTPLTVSQKDFLSAGNGTYSSTITSMSSTAPGSTATPSMTTITTTSDGHVETITKTAGTPTNTGTSNNNDNSGMSSTTRIGIIAGATVAGVAIVAVFAFFLIRMWRNRQAGEEQRPMLGSDGGFNDGRGPSDGSHMSGTELSRLSGVNQGGNNTYDWKAGAVPEHSDAKWAQDPYLTSASPGLYQQQSTGVYELPVQEGAQMPVEMPATPMVTGASPVYHHPAGQPHNLDPNAYR